MKAVFFSIVICICFSLEVTAQQVLGNFTGQDAEEWPRVVWYRDTANGWDEGLIKTQSAKGPYNRTGFGIHMHDSRQFGFWSTGWKPLFVLEGGSGNAYLRGSLAIGTTSSAAKLAVKGSIHAEEIKVAVANWPDYVFAPGHGRLSLFELERFIGANQRLPEVPSAAFVQKNGISLGEMNTLMLKKIEELTLYLIDQAKLIQSLEEDNRRYHKQDKRLLALEKRVNSIAK